MFGPDITTKFCADNGLGEAGELSWNIEYCTLMNINMILEHLVCCSKLN